MGLKWLCNRLLFVQSVLKQRLSNYCRRIDMLYNMFLIVKPFCWEKVNYQ